METPCGMGPWHLPIFSGKLLSLRAHDSSFEAPTGVGASNHNSNGPTVVDSIWKTNPTTLVFSKDKLPKLTFFCHWKRQTQKKTRCLEVISDLTERVPTPLPSPKNGSRPANSSEDCCQPQCRSHVWKPREWKQMEKTTCGIVGTSAGHGVYFDIYIYMYIFMLVVGLGLIFFW